MARRVGSGSSRMVSDWSPGDDVAGLLEGLADQGVGFVGGAGGDGVERGDPDGVGDEFGFDVEDLLAGVDLAEW